MDGNGLALGKVGRRMLMLAPLLFLTLFFLYPLLFIFTVSLAPQGQLDLSSFARVVTSSYYRETLWFTLYQALLSTGLTVGLALPVAYVFARYHFPGKSLFLSLSTLPFVLPTVVVAAAFTALIGPRGILNASLMSVFSLSEPPIQLERTLALIVIVHIFYNFSIALRIITTQWMNQNPRIEEAARILGASGWRVWWHIRLPLLQPAIAAAAVLVFVFTFTSFGVVLLLGGPRFATLEVEIYRQTANLFNLPVAAALSLIQIVIMFTMMLIYTRLQSRITVGLVSAQAIGRSPSSLAQRLLVILTLSFMGVMLFVPLLALLVMSFTVGGNGLNVQYFQQLGVNARNSVLFVPPVQAIGNSLLFAVLTTVLAVILGVLTAYIVARRGRGWFSFLDPLFALPLAVSAATLGFGYIISFDSPPLNIRSSPLLIPVAHTLVAMPFVVRSLLPALRSIPSNLQESGRMLGAEPARVWWYIEFPLISQALLVGATFAFTVSMGEFGASLFIARPDTPTIPIVIFRLLGQPGVSNYGQALAMSTILMVVCAACFVLIERLRAVGVGEF